MAGEALTSSVRFTSYQPSRVSGTYSGLGPSFIFSLHLGQSVVGVLQELLDVLRVFLLHLKLLLLHGRHGGVQLRGQTDDVSVVPLIFFFSSEGSVGHEGVDAD